MSWQATKPDQVVRSRTATATENLPAFAGSGVKRLARLDVTAASGTSPTLNVKVQDSADGGTTWVDTGQTFAQKTAVSSEVKVLDLSAENTLYRYVATIAGTSPSFTYSIESSEAVL